MEIQNIFDLCMLQRPSKWIHTNGNTKYMQVHTHQMKCEEKAHLTHQEVARFNYKSNNLHKHNVINTLDKLLAHREYQSREP